MELELPTEFLTLAQLGTMGGLSLVVTGIVEFTKDKVRLRTQLWAWLVASVLLFVATVLLNWPLPDALEWGRTAFISLCNGVIVALGAVGVHQVGIKLGVLGNGKAKAA